MINKKLLNEKLLFLIKNESYNMIHTETRVLVAHGKYEDMVKLLLSQNKVKKSEKITLLGDIIETWETVEITDWTDQKMES